MVSKKCLPTWSLTMKNSGIEFSWISGSVSGRSISSFLSSLQLLLMFLVKLKIILYYELYQQYKFFNANLKKDCQNNTWTSEVKNKISPLTLAMNCLNKKLNTWDNHIK